jgi:glucokinase
MSNKTNIDPRIIMTLDAGGTNFIFSAIREQEEIISPINRSAYPDDLEKCLGTVVEGFEEVKKQLQAEPAAISFAFPGPADYKTGIIGDLPNFTAFTGGVPLGPMLEDHFGIPVYINNDGNLFAYGEALVGYLPSLNKRLKQAGSMLQYNSLIGLTLGTGFGSGVVLENKMLLGEGSCGAEIHSTLNVFNPDWNAEESVSTRAIQRVYAEAAGLPFSSSLMPKDIYDIAKGSRKGEQSAAIESFRKFGEGLGNSIANVLAVIDGIVVLGGGIIAAWDLFSPFMIQEINRDYSDHKGILSPRLSFKVYNLEDDSVFDEFASGKIKEITVPGSGRKILHDDLPRTGIGKSKLGASKTIALGAYAFALQQLDS